MQPLDAMALVELVALLLAAIGSLLLAPKVLDPKAKLGVWLIFAGFVTGAGLVSYRAWGWPALTTVAVLLGVGLPLAIRSSRMGPSAKT